MNLPYEPAPVVPGQPPQAPVWPPPDQVKIVRKAPWWIWLVVAAAFIAGCGLGLAAGVGGSNAGAPTAATQPQTTPAGQPVAHASPAAPVPTSIVPTTPRTTTKPPPPPAPTVDDGTWTVGTDMPAGKYRTTALVDSNCYWEIDKSGTNGANIIQNDFPGGGRPTVTLKVGEDFKTDGCGTWQKIG